MNYKSLLSAAVCCLFAFCFDASAQPQPQPQQRPQGAPQFQPGPGGGPREQLDPEVAAKQKADKMSKDLLLTEKQYKKVYKLYLKEEKVRTQNAYGMGFPMGGGMPMMGGGGMPPMGGGMPPQNMEPGQFPEGMPPVGMDNNKESEERIAKKLKKILTEQQYDKWESLRAFEDMPGMPRR